MFVLRTPSALGLLLCLLLAGCNGGTSTGTEAGGGNTEVPGTSVPANDNADGNDNSDQNDNGDADNNNNNNDNAPVDQEDATNKLTSI